MQARKPVLVVIRVTPEKPIPGFTRIDLVAAIAAIAVLGLIAFPGLAGSRSVAEIQVCFSNLRQLTRAWSLYSEDNSGRLAGNLDGGDAQNGANTNRSWAVGWLDFNGGVPGANTNTLLLKNAQLGRYVDSVAIYKCPSDSSLSRGRSGAPRVRSVSMNAYLGERAAPFSGGYKQFRTIQSIVEPKPADCFVFIEEREDSINDPWFIVGMDGFDPVLPSLLRWVDFPADWHDGSAVLSFVDGHTEAWRWLDPRTRPPHNLGRFIELSVSSPGNPDVSRIQRAASRKIVP